MPPPPPPSPRCHRFFKVFFPELSSERLKIPPPFMKHMEEGFPPLNTVSLKGPGGGIWSTNLVSSNSGELFFETGWKEFAHDHSLETGDFLVFRYSGNLQFDVLLFDTTACEKEAAFTVRPNADKEDAASRKSEMSMGVAESNDDCVVLEGPVPKKPCRCCCEEDHSAEVSVHSRKTVDTSTKRDESMLPCGVPKKHPESTKYEHTPRTEDVFVSRKGQNSLRSQRRPVTLEELDKAFVKAKAFKSHRPFSLVKMCDSYVYYGSFIHIPSYFARKYIPDDDRRLILWDPNGKRWEVRFISHGNRCGFSAGWHKFSYTNNLETGDICIFEVIKKYEMRVHIFRVVEEIAPLVRY